MKTTIARAMVATVLATLGLLLVGSLADPPLAADSSAGWTEAAGPDPDPRLPIPASAAPAAPFVIDRPGSYWLAGDRRCAGDGIRVEADDVTIDLMGFALIGPDSGATVGIRMNGQRNVEIRNGTVRDFGERGVHDRNEPGTAFGKRLLDLRSLSNGSCGLCIGGDGNLIRGCTVAGNKGTGLCCGRSLVVDNTFLDNETGGISAGEGSRVVGNTVRGSGRTGITARTGCLIRDNVVSKSGNSGIYAEFGCLLEGNVAFANNLSDTTDSYGGFKVVGDCLVRGNLARDNRRCNLLALRSGNVVAGNLATASTDSLGDGFFFRRPENWLGGNWASHNRRDFAGELPDRATAAENVALPHWTAPATPAATAASAATPGPVPAPSGDRR